MAGKSEGEGADWKSRGPNVGSHTVDMARLRASEDQDSCPNRIWTAVLAETANLHNTPWPPTPNNPLQHHAYNLAVCRSAKPRFLLPLKQTVEHLGWISLDSLLPREVAAPTNEPGSTELAAARAAESAPLIRKGSAYTSIPRPGKVATSYLLCLSLRMRFPGIKPARSDRGGSPQKNAYHLAVTSCKRVACCAQPFLLPS
jgi:hypothetical protein